MTNEVVNSSAKKHTVINGNKKEIRLNFSRNSYVIHIIITLINVLITSKPPLLTLSGFMVLLVVINSSFDELEPLKCRITLIIPLLK